MYSLEFNFNSGHEQSWNVKTANNNSYYLKFSFRPFISAS